ncbi:CaiB/BaiF CoA transferase family protein [Kitasatospora sp. NPDC089509]|uniref:CaiB/BaiF CoA transferase family protein n=1 Tax=Kitasatospora sp. NPDC089509 TaxID=3364079 RepID=UPI00381148E4
MPDEENGPADGSTSSPADGLEGDPGNGPGNGPGGDAPLAGLRVLDAATLFAGPLAASLLGDFGADVVKIEHPRGDPARGNGAQVDGVSLWWKTVARNKRAVTLNLAADQGRELFLRLAREADVVVENFRPGTFERWGLDPATLAAANPRLVLLRVTGFGQVGPMRERAGFGTLAEAMSGFAYSTGQPDGPPTLPPFGLADGIAGIAGAFAVLAALRARERTGRGQVIDLSLLEPILAVLGPQLTVFQQLGLVQERVGNRSVNNAPRNTYRCRDGRWVAVSTSAQNIAERVLHLVGRPDLAARPWFADGHGRAAHVEELDAAVGAWIAERDGPEVIAAFERARAAVAPVQHAGDLLADPQLRALGAIVHLDDPELGDLALQGPLARLSETPGRLRWAGRPSGADNAEVYGALGVGAERLAELRRLGVV